MTAGIVAAADVSGGVGTYSAEVLADLPLGYWKLDDVAASGVMADSSGNGRHGTYGSAAAATTGPSGAAGTALDGNGLSTGIGSVPFASWMNRSGSLSIELWVQVPITGDARVMFGQASGTSDPYFAFHSAGTHFSGLNLRTGGASSAVGGLTADNDNVFHHEVFVWTGTQILIYRDGVLDNSGPKSGALGTISTALQIGGRGQDYSLSNLAQVAFYSQALTATRVAAHYAARGSM